MRLPHRTVSSKFWKVVRFLSGAKSVAGNHPIDCNGEKMLTAKDILNTFNIQYTQLKNHRSNKEKTKQKIYKFSLENQVKPGFSVIL